MSKDKSWWAIFRSMRMGLYLMLGVITASIIGTIIPQRHAGRLEGWLNTFLQLSDLYHSWWYIALLSLLTLNLMACSFYRFKTFRLSKSNSYPLLDMEQLMRLKTHISIVFTGEIAEVKTRLVSTLAGQRYEIWTETLDGKCRVGARHGSFGVWGSLITHCSFLIIIAGILVGAVWGWEGSINVPVGTTFNLSNVSDINLKDVKNDFQVRVDGFWIERYPDGSPSGYFSRLTVLENNREIETSTLGVNNPIYYQGTKFYQARYGDAIEIQVNGPDARTIYRGFIIGGSSVRIPGTDYIILAKLDYGKNASSTSIPTDTSYIKVLYGLFKDGQSAGMGTAELGGAINLGQGGSSLEFVRTVPYTGLLVKKDPGIPFIWLGFVFMLLGMSATFFIQPCKLWIVLEQEGKLLRVGIGGKTSRNQSVLTGCIHSLARKIQPEE